MRNPTLSARGPRDDRVRDRARAIAGVLAATVLALTGCARSRPAVPVPSPPAITPLEQLQRDLTATTQSPGVAHGVWGIAVHSIDRDERLFSMNPDTLLVPASTAKLVTVATAAEAVGWDYRFATTMSASGPVVDITASAEADAGVLKSDLLITGSGDPTTGGRGGEELSAWVEGIKAMGIRRIDGRIIGDDDALEEPRPSLAWAWDDLGYPTGATFGALNLAENRLTVTIAPGATIGAPAVVSTAPAAVRRPLMSRVVTVAATESGLIWPEQRPGEPYLTIAGTIPIGSGANRLTVSAGNPTLWFASVLRASLIAAGIPVLGEEYDIDDLAEPIDRSTFSAIATHRSPPLGDIVRPLLKESINVYAEAVMRLNVASGVFPTNDAALDGLRRRLASWNIAPEGYQLVDGSGLSRRDVVTASTLVAVLRRMHDASGSSPWMRALPVAGVDGSLQSRMRGTAAEGNVRAKTGTMSNVRSLAGYVTTRDGERIAFAVLLNNFEGTGAAATNAVDAMAIRLANFSRRAITLP